MTYKENITAILECCFAGFGKEIIDSACNRILELEPFINKPCVSKGACYEDKIKQGYGMIETIWEDVDKEEISKSVMLLDLFTKTFCRYRNDYERFNDLKFRCDECPFQTEAGSCKVKKFKAKYAPNYRDFGSMGDL